MKQIITIIMLLQLSLMHTAICDSGNPSTASLDHKVLIDLQKGDITGGNSVIIASNPLQGLIDFIRSAYSNRVTSSEDTFSNTTSRDDTFSNTTSRDDTFSNTTSSDDTFSNTTSRDDTFSNTTSSDDTFSNVTFSNEI